MNKYYKIIDINESYCQLETDDINFKKRVLETLSVFEDGYRFDPRFRAGIWDGKKHFYTIESNTNVQFPKGLVGYIIKDLQKLEYTYEYNPISVRYDLDFQEFSDFIDTLELPFSPYDYQLQAAFDMITLRRLTLRSATSSGKSLIAYLFFRYMLSQNMNSLLVVPSINLVDQMFSDFQDYGFKDAEKYIKQIGGDHKGSKDLSEKPIVISTWQSLYQMTSDNFSIFDCIVADECLDGDTKISMADGRTKKIKDVQKGDMVLTISEETQEYQIKEVQKLHINIPSEEMYEIESEMGTLKITGNHKVNTKLGWKRADELTLDDEIISISS